MRRYRILPCRSALYDVQADKTYPQMLQAGIKGLFERVIIIDKREDVDNTVWRPYNLIIVNDRLLQSNVE